MSQSEFDDISTEDTSAWQIQGRYIRACRRRTGMTAAQLAMLLGLPPDKYLQIESGDAEASSDLLHELEQTIGLDLREAERICRIGHVFHLLRVYRALDDNFPR